MGCRIHNHSRTHISTSSFFLNRRLPTLQRPKETTVRLGMPEVWGGWSRRSTCCVQLALCRGCTGVLKSHPSRHISSLFLGNASHSRRTCRSMCSSCSAPRHDFSVDGSYCIPEQRDTSNYWTPGKDALQPVGFELSSGAHTRHRQSQWISATHFLPSDILVPRALTLRVIPVLRGQFLQSILKDNSNATGRSRIANHQFSKISSSIRATSTPAIDVSGQPHVLSAIFERSVPLSNTTRFHCAITLHHHQENKFRP
jgi:hypothetical protein